MTPVVTIRIDADGNVASCAASAGIQVDLIDERISARPFRLVEAAQPPDRSAVLARAIDATDRAERDVRIHDPPRFPRLR